MNYREEISLVELFNMFPDNETARKWFEDQMWPDGPLCPHCKTMNVQSNINHKTMTHRCRECDDKPMFSVKKGSIMEGSNIPYRKWVIAIYLVTTSLKGVSSMKLHRDLKISQKSTWYMLHRIREAYETDNPLYDGPVEVNETYS
ncbi:MAG: IS1595 family transposase [Gammaproteobacteria bacterium]|nr:IS1595 family transposase [Gammaproteobacteria bacterium]